MYANYKESVFYVNKLNFRKEKHQRLKYRFINLCMRNEGVIVMNENVSRSVLPSVARWAVNFLQLWDTVMARLSFSPPSIKINRM